MDLRNPLRLASLSGLLGVLLASGCVARPLPIGAVDLGRAPDLAGPDLVSPPLDLAGAGIGDPCTSSGMFEQGSCSSPDQICLSPDFGFPEGYCVQRCDAAGECPPGGTCLDVGNGDQICFQSCKDTGDCRDGYACDPDAAVCLPPDIGGEGEVTPGTRDGGACVTPIVAPTAGAFGANKLLSNADAFGAEVQLAVDPKTKNVVVAWIGYDQTDDGIVFSSSTDNGETFSQPVYLPDNDGVTMTSTSSDPVVTVDPSGSFYIVWIGYDQSQMSPDPTNMNVFVARSDDGGASFPKVFRATPTTEWEVGGIDKPWISASPADGSVIATWQVTDYNTGDSTIRMARTTDQGVTWSTPISVSEKRSKYYRNLAMVHHDPNGRAYVVWTEVLQDALGDVENRVYLQVFEKDGSKLGGNVLVTGGSDSPTFEDASVVSDGTHVYVGFISGNDSGAWDVRVAKSDDGGASFSPSVKVNDDVSCATHFHHALAIGEDGGVHAVWFDNRYLVGSVFYARSTSGPNDALVFSPNSFVSDETFEFTTSRSSELWLGDYLGLQILGKTLYAAWTDPRSGLANIRFAKGMTP